MDDDYSTGGGWGDFFGGLARTAGDAYTANQNARRKPETKPAVVQPVTDWKKYMPLAIGGVVLLVVLGVVAKMFK